MRYKCYHLKLSKTLQSRVFISHNHRDREFVESLITELKALGVDTWYSATDVQKGALWTAEIRKAISKCNWMAVIVSKNSANSKWIRREVDLGMTAAHLEDQIIPVLVDDTELREVNEYLPTMQAIKSSQIAEIARLLVERFAEEERNDRWAEV